MISAGKCGRFVPAVDIRGSTVTIITLQMPTLKDSIYDPCDRLGYALPKGLMRLLAYLPVS